MNRRSFLGTLAAVFVAPACVPTATAAISTDVARHLFDVYERPITTVVTPRMVRFEFWDRTEWREITPDGTEA